MAQSYCLRLLLISSLLCIFSLKSVSLNYYWVGNSGKWTELSHWATSPGGSTLHTQIPTALDDVFFDGNSFTIPGQSVDFDALTILAHNINWTGATNTPALISTTPNSVLRIYGSLTLVPGMAMNFPGPVYFEATTTGQTILSAGKVFANDVLFNGIGGEWTLQDAIASGKIILNAGVLNTNNKTVTTPQFWSISNTTRILNMGSSVFNLTGGTAWRIENAGCTINCGTSVINLSATTASFLGNTTGTDTYYDLNFTGFSGGIITGASNFHDVIFMGRGDIYNTGSFHNVTIQGGGALVGNNSYNDLNFTAGFLYLLGYGTVQTINGTFTAIGTCSSPVIINSNLPGYISTISHPPATVNVSFAILRDVQATGGANFLANNSTDLGNNTGWTFVPAPVQNLYWIGNSGNWNDGNHWSHTSGGPPSGCAPTPSDNVFFDANSFSATAQTVLINVLSASCRNMDWTGVTNNPTLGSVSISNRLNIYGSLKFVPGMNLAFEGKVNFEATTPGQTITTGTKVFKNETRFNGGGGEWTLQDTFNSDTSIIHIHGTINTNNQTVNASDFTSSNYFPRVLNLGSSILNMHGIQAWILGGANLNFNSGTSVINLTNRTAALRNNTQDVMIYHNVNFTGYVNGSIIGSAYFHDVAFSAKGNIYDSCRFHTATFFGDGEMASDNVYDYLNFSAGYTYRLPMFHTQTINSTFNAAGTCGAFITISSTMIDSTAFIKQLSGQVNVANTVMRDIHPVGSASYIASGSIDLGNNTGWTFSNIPTAHNLYWIGNGGNWSDGNHWSLTSGGPPSGCAPTLLDNVFFDANSFSVNGQRVAINVTTAYCRNMDWTGSLHGPILDTATDFHVLKIYGSLRFVSLMQLKFKGKVHFEASTAGQTITSAARPFLNDIEFNGVGGEWTLLDKLDAGLSIWLNNGTLNTNSQDVKIGGGLYSLLNTTRALNMGSSVFDIDGGLAWLIDKPGITINCGTSVINCNNIFGAQFGGNSGSFSTTYYDLNFATKGSLAGTCNFHNVLFGDTSSIFHSCNFNKADFLKVGNIFSDNSFDTLNFTAGYSYTLSKNHTQTINETLNASGACGSLITITSDMPDSTTTISHPPGAVNISDVILKDVHATGGAIFTANNCLDLGNNTGWTINAVINPDLYWIGNNGNWDDGNHWSFTSGGTPSGCTPSVLNNVIFDANSFSTGGQVVSVNVLMAYCRDMNWTGVTNTPAFASTQNTNQLKIYGSLTFDPNMIMGLAGKVNFEAITPGKTITMNGNTFANDVAFNGSGEWILQDVFVARNIYLNKGTLNTNDKNVSANSFFSLTNATSTLNMGSSVFNLSADSAWKVINTGLTINSGTSVINCISPSANFRDNSIPVHTYYDVNFTGTVKNSISGTSNFHNVNFAGKGYIYQPNTFHDVFFNGDGQVESSNVFHDLNLTSTHTYILWESSTQTVNNRWLIQGSCTEYILLQTNNAGFFATVSCATDTVFGHNIHLRDIHGTGAADFMAYNSVDLGGNAGWNFTILPPLSNVGAINGPTSVCAGSTAITYQVTAVQGAINYQWTVPAGATITGGQGTDTITVDFGSVVSGSITVLACGGCGCSNTSISSPIVVSAPLTPTVALTATPGNSICSGTAVSFTAIVAGTGSGTVAYDFQVNNISVQYGSSNTYNTSSLADADEIVCIITVTGSGCFASNSVSSNLITLTVLSQLTPAVSLSANPGVDICSGTVITFTATATNTATATITYDFKINGTTIQSGNLNTYTSATLADGDVVTCAISLSTGTGNCFSSTDALSNSLTIHSTVSLTPSVAINVDPGTTVCPATPVTFTATTNGTGTGTINYDFKINGNSVQNSSSNVYSSTVLDADVITCVISITGGTCLTSNTATSNSIVMNVDANSGNVNVNAGMNVTISAGETVQLNASGDAGTYLWSPSTGLSATNILDPIASPAVTTTYTLTITNTFGCSAFDDIKIEIKNIPGNDCAQYPMIAFTPNGDGINDKWIVWQGNCSISTRVTVFNRYGAIVFQSQQYQNDWQGMYKGKPLPDGTYYFIVEYRLNNGSITTKRNNVTILR